MIFITGKRLNISGSLCSEPHLTAGGALKPSVSSWTTFTSASFFVHAGRTQAPIRSGWCLVGWRWHRCYFNQVLYPTQCIRAGTKCPPETVAEPLSCSVATQAHPRPEGLAGFLQNTPGDSTCVYLANPNGWGWLAGIVEQQQPGWGQRPQGDGPCFPGSPEHHPKV